MSRAFTREEDSEAALADIGERPVSSERNLVTANGLAMIDAAMSSLREDLAKAEASGDRMRIASASRDLRYWSSAAKARNCPFRSLAAMSCASE